MNKFLMDAMVSQMHRIELTGELKRYAISFEIFIVFIGSMLTKRSDISRVMSVTLNITFKLLRVSLRGDYRLLLTSSFSDCEIFDILSFIEILNHKYFFRYFIQRSS